MGQWKRHLRYNNFTETVAKSRVKSLLTRYHPVIRTREGRQLRRLFKQLIEKDPLFPKQRHVDAARGPPELTAV
jgi:hypothetical protein